MQKFFSSLCAVTLGISACVLTGCQANFTKTHVTPLYVGVSPDNPPIIFKKNHQILGFEADCARELARALQRPLYLVELPWDEQIDALLADKIDIIMSGLTITPERSIRIAFTDSHLQQGKMALIRRADRERFGSSAKILNANVNFAVQKKTTSDVYVQQYCRTAASVAWMDPRDAAAALSYRSIDIYIHDELVILWMASENEADLMALPLPGEKDPMAWGIKKTDTELLAVVNQLLAQWKEDGTMTRLKQRWLPGN